MRLVRWSGRLLRSGCGRRMVWEAGVGRYRVRFSEPQRVADVMGPDVPVWEVVVEADRLVLMRGDAEVQLDVASGAVAEVTPVVADDGAGGKAKKPRVRGGHEGSSWTDDEVSRLREAWEAGAKTSAQVRELAAAHGRTEGAIRARLKALGLVSWS